MYRKNVAGQHLGFTMVSATDGSAITSGTVTARRVIDNGTQATAGGTVSHKGNGQYNFALAQADTNGDYISLFFTHADAIPVEKTIVTTAANPTDAVRFGLTALPNAAAEAAGGLYTRGTGAGQINQPANGMVDGNIVRYGGTAGTFASGRPEVNASHWGGTAVASAVVNTQVGLRKNIAVANFPFLMVDDQDHVSGKTGLTVTAQRSIDGGTFGATTNSPVEIANGLYRINLSAADLNGDTIVLRFTATGADPTVLTIRTSA